MNSESTWPRWTPTLSQFQLWYPVIIILGAALLKTPGAAAEGPPLTWLDAIFMSTSAATLTGLNIREVADDFSVWGQLAILLLIEISGLMLIAMTTALFHRLAKRMASFVGSSLRPAIADLSPEQAVGWALKWALGLQILGVVATFALWQGSFTSNQRLMASLFGGVGAICQIGFTSIPGGMISQRYGPALHAVLTPLMFIGALGAPISYELWRLGGRLLGRNKPVVSVAGQQTPCTLSPAGRMVVMVCLGAYLAGVVALSIAQLTPYSYRFFKQGMESNASETGPLDLKRVSQVLADSSSLSVSARTCGMRTAPIETGGNAGECFLMGLMFVGGGPGSAAGGAGVLAVGTLIAIALGKPDQDSVMETRMAVRTAVSLIGLIFLSIFLLSLSEPYPFLKVAFEAWSAGTNCGMSAGIAGDMTKFGKAILVMTMFLGRSLPMLAAEPEVG